MAFLTLFRIATGDNWNGIMKVYDDFRDELLFVSNECILEGNFLPTQLNEFRMHYETTVIHRMNAKQTVAFRPSWRHAFSLSLCSYHSLFSSMSWSPF